jgi:hypothetical protein
MKQNRLQLLLGAGSLLLLVFASGADASTIAPGASSNTVVITQNSDLSIWGSDTGGTWNWTMELAKRWVPSWAPQAPAQFSEAIEMSPPVFQPAPMPPPASSAPEPSGVLLFAAGFTVFAMARKRRS